MKRAHVLRRLTGKSQLPNRTQEILDELVEELAAHGIQHKALLDEESGVLIEPKDFAAAIAEALAGSLETIPENLSDICLEAVDTVIAAGQPVPVPPRGDAEVIAAMRDEERQIRAAQTSLITELTTDIASLTQDMSQISEVIEQLTKLPGLVGSLATAVVGIEKQMKSTRPTDGVDVESLLETIKMQAAEQISGSYPYPEARRKDPSQGVK